MSQSEIFEYYFTNALERLKNPHRINNVFLKTTINGLTYVQIVYHYNHIEGKRVDFEGQFVSIFYQNKYQLEKIYTLTNLNT